jgi:hypothetical protein
MMRQAFFVCILLALIASATAGKLQHAPGASAPNCVAAAVMQLQPCMVAAAVVGVLPL